MKLFEHKSYILYILEYLFLGIKWKKISTPFLIVYKGDFSP